MQKRETLIEFDKEIFNPVYLDLLDIKARYINCMGGGGSGKSVGIAQNIVVRSLQEQNNIFIVARKVANTNRDSTFQLFQSLVDDYNLNSMFRFTVSPMVCTIPSTNSKILFKGLDNREKIKSITNATCIWMEEATEFSLLDFTQLDLRLRGQAANPLQMYLSYNPIDPDHWLNERFFVKDMPNSYSLITTYKDNKFIDDAYESVLRRLKDIDPTYWSIYGEAEWSKVQGLIYDNWIVTEEFPEDLEDYCYGLDFGYVHPMALVKVGIKNGIIYIKELLYEPGLTVDDLIQRMLDMDISKTQPIYCDHNPSDIEQIRRNGFNALPAKKVEVSIGIRYLKQYQLVFDSFASNGLLEIKKYKWMEDRNGNPIGKPVKFMDDFMDALRYAIYSHGIQYWYKPINYKPASYLTKKIDRIGKYSTDIY